MGLTNLQIMIPFVRTLGQAKAVTEALAEQGLKRGENGLKLIMMCEIPSNAVLAEQFLEYFDGFSIGSNDMTQLTLGLDRDSALVAADFDERDPAVKAMLSMAIRACRDAGKYVGICGQGPSDHADFADWLVKEGIESVSLNPDTVIDTWLYLAEHAAKRSGHHQGRRSALCRSHPISPSSWPPRTTIPGSSPIERAENQSCAVRLGWPLLEVATGGNSTMTQGLARPGGATASGSSRRFTEVAPACTSRVRVGWADARRPNAM
jgi:hypothetical protein